MPQTSRSIRSKIRRRTAPGVEIKVHANTAAWLMTALANLGYVKQSGQVGAR